MAELKDRIRADLTAALKARDSLRASTLRMAIAAMTNAEVAGKEARELTDEAAACRQVRRCLSHVARRRRWHR